MMTTSPGRLASLLAVTVLALVFVPALSGCEGDYRPRAIGKEGQVTVVMDSTHWTGPVGESLRDNVMPWVETLPVSERYFQIRHLELTSERTYESIQDLKNVIIVAPLSDSTNEAQFLRRRLSDDARQAIEDGQIAVVDKPNLWRRSQRVYFVTAATPDALTNALQKQGPQIRTTFQEVTLQRMKREMYDTDRQYALEDSLMDRHGFALNIQNTFQIAVDTTTASSGVVWLRRLLAKTRREFLVYYEENASPNQLSPEWIHATQDSLTRKYMQGNIAGFVRTDYRRPLDTEQVSFQGRYGYKVEGLWRMVVPTEEDDFRSAGGGGPFVTYAFYDQAQDRIYLLSGSVFAPGFDKLQFVRQMEVMARTFRTRAETQNQQVTASASE